MSFPVIGCINFIKCSIIYIKQEFSNENKLKRAVSFPEVAKKLFQEKID